MPIFDERGRAYMFDPDGDPVTVAAADVEKALGAGWKEATPEQAQEIGRRRALRAKYDTPGQAAFAALEGVESGLTLGILPWLRSKAGLMDAEAAAARAEFNPTARTAGSIVGAVAPALVTGGGSLLAQGGARAAAAGAAQVGARSAAARALAATPAGLATRAGEAVTRSAAARLVPAAGGSTAREIAARAAATGLGSAVEGAAFGAGELLDETALGNPQTLGEAAAATVLAGAGGALFGSGLAAVLGGVAAGARGVAAKVQRGTNDPIVAWMEGRTAGGGYPEYLRRRGVTDQPDQVADLIRKRDKIIWEPETRTRLANEVTERMQDQYERVQWELRDASNKVRPVEVATLIAQDARAGNLGDWTGAYTKVVKGTSDLIQEMTDRPDLHSSYFRGVLKDIRDALEKDATKAGATPAGAFARLDAAKQRLDDYSKWGRDIEPRERHSIEAFRSLRNAIADVLEDEAVWGAAARRQAEYNAALSTLLTKQTILERTLAFPTVEEGGRRIFKVDPTKLGVMLNNPAGGLGQRRADAIDEFLDAADSMREQIRASMQNVPVDRRFNLDTTAAARGAYDEAWTAADATQRYKQRGSTDILTSAPALSQAGQAGQQLSGMAMPAMVGGVALGPVGALGGAALSGGLAGRRLLGDPKQMIDVLRWYERHAGRITPTVDAAARKLVRATQRAESARGVGAALTGKGIASQFITKDGQLDQERAARLRAVASDPEQLIDAVMAVSGPADGSTPQITTGLQAATGRALEFLASKLPPERRTGPLGTVLEPSPAEVSRFRRYVEVVEQPAAVLEHATAGTLTPEHVETLRVVYPAIYAEVQRALLEALAAPGARPSYQQRQMISMILGQDVDGARALGASIRARQAANEEQPPPVGPSPKATPARADKLDVASRVATPQQQSATRGMS